MAQKASLVKQFEGQAVTTIHYRDRPVWIAREIGRVLGYEEEGRGFRTRITGEWSEDLEEGTDYMVVQGDELRDLRTALGTEGVPSGDSPIPDRAPSLTLLTESGLHLALMLSRKPAGRRLRRWLATEVLPEIARTGGYRAKGARALASPEDRQRRLALREASAVVHGARERRKRAEDLLELAKRIRREAHGRDRQAIGRAMRLEGEATALLRDAEAGAAAAAAGGGLAGQGPRLLGELNTPAAEAQLDAMLRFLHTWWRLSPEERRQWWAVELGRIFPAWERARRGLPPGPPEEVTEIRCGASLAERSWRVHDVGPDGVVRTREVRGTELMGLGAELVFDPDGDVRARVVTAAERQGGRLFVLEPLHVKAAAIAGEERDLVRQFLADECDRGEGLTVYASDLYRAYVDWCDRHDTMPLKKCGGFTPALRACGAEPMRRGGNASVRGYRGIALKAGGPRDPGV
jgi:prophage antirepressor-like protein